MAVPPSESFEGRPPAHDGSTARGSLPVVIVFIIAMVLGFGFAYLMSGLRSSRSSTVPPSTASNEVAPGSPRIEVIDLRPHARRYARFVPAGSPPPGGWPIIVFLHGRMEAGDDPLRAVGVGIGPALMRDASRFPAVVVFPQFPTGESWKTDERANDVIAALDHTLGTVSTSVARVTLTGLSMGGQGVYEVASRHPDRFKRLGPICGWASGSADVLATLPTWIHHGEKDTVIPSSESVTMRDRLKAEGAADVRLSLYPEDGHDSWSRAYADPEFVAWLIAPHPADAAGGE
jgi:pimeloyl-ACP methyl ester carboxylesterase